MTPAPQPEQVQIFRAAATPEDFRKANIGDWIQGVGEVTTESEKNFIRNFGTVFAPTSAEQVLLKFPDKETADYVKLVCRRKNTFLEDYIIDNFEWDDQPECIRNAVGIITSKVCEGCDFLDRCPDFVKTRKGQQKELRQRGREPV